MLAAKDGIEGAMQLLIISNADLNLQDEVQQDHFDLLRS